MGVAYEFYLLEPRSCRQSHAYFEGISMARVPRGFSSIAPGCCLSTLLQPEHENSNSRVKLAHAYVQHKNKLAAININDLL